MVGTFVACVSIRDVYVSLVFLCCQSVRDAMSVSNLYLLTPSITGWFTSS